MAILNGTTVSSSEINPVKHKFIGVFRQPTMPIVKGDCFMCDCGQVLWTAEAVQDHWRLGHMDVPQYIDI